jgi:uncharacterized membrane protein YjgN (DUF898 family)
MTTSTMPMDVLPAHTAAPPHAEPQTHSLTLRFTASGSEYFRIWIVNLLLTLITAGLYLPWAKVRRLRYFHGNTLVGGHALDFHGNPSRMLRGQLLTGALFAMYGVASKVSPMAGAIALLILAALWPALFRAALQFRLSNTSWRGLRFEFTGSLGGAYRTLLPLFLPTLFLVAFGALASVNKKPSTAVGIALMAGLVASMLTLPWCLLRLKRYQHDHYRLGQWQTRLTLTAGRYYGIFLKTSAIGIGLTALAVGLAVLAMVGGASNAAKPEMARTITMVAVGYAVFLLAYLGMLQPYATARLQNAVWSHTGNRELRFESHLRARSLIALSLKNWLLMVLTLGLYWPFASIALRRLRLQAVTLHLTDSPNRLMAGAGLVRHDAAGDAAGDFFGIDIGL